MKSRPKLSGAPLAYALAQVDDAGDPYKAFGQAIWVDDGAVPAFLKELVCLRTSVVNQCPT